MQNKSPKALPHRHTKAIVLASAASLLVVAGLAWVANQEESMPTKKDTFAHRGVTTTIFWVGEQSNASNDYIPNDASTWTENWVGAYGGVDDPDDRCGLLPCGFTPKENPFYFALPYSDLLESCEAKPSQRDVPWYRPGPAGSSIIKNQWIKIRYKDKIAYAQWEDAGPAGEDDTAYVFGSAKPKARAGLDLSPATAAYLGLDGMDKTDWQFVSAEDVPKGPWLTTVTASPPDCAP